LKLKRWEKIGLVGFNQNKTGISLLASNKVDAKARGLMGNKEEYILMFKKNSL
jgi:hypothetical protein